MISCSAFSPPASRRYAESIRSTRPFSMALPIARSMSIPLPTVCMTVAMLLRIGSSMLAMLYVFREPVGDGAAACATGAGVAGFLAAKAAVRAAIAAAMSVDAAGSCVGVLGSCAGGLPAGGTTKPGCCWFAGGGAVITCVVASWLMRFLA